MLSVSFQSVSENDFRLFAKATQAHSYSLRYVSTFSMCFVLYLSSVPNVFCTLPFLYSGELPFQCPQCDLKVKTKGSLKDHLKTYDISKQSKLRVRKMLRITVSHVAVIRGTVLNHFSKKQILKPSKITVSRAFYFSPGDTCVFNAGIWGLAWEVHIENHTRWLCKLVTCSR